MGIKVHRVYDEAHAAMEAGKSISATKLHLMTGHTGEHFLKPTANYMKLKLIGRLPDRIPSATPVAEPPRDAKDSGSARSHSTHLETSSSNRP